MADEVVHHYTMAHEVVQHKKSASMTECSRTTTLATQSSTYSGLQVFLISVQKTERQWYLAHTTVMQHEGLQQYYHSGYAI